MSPGPVTRRTCSWPVRRPSRTTRLRSSPVCVRRSKAGRPCSRHQASDLLAGERWSARRPAGSRSTGTMSCHEPGAWKPQISVPSVAGPERVLELVAIAPLLDGRDDVVELEALEAADPRQRVAHLLVLDLELALVGQHLPRRAGMVGERRDALGAGLEHLERARLGVGALALRDDRADEVAGDRAGDEDDVALQARDAVAAVGECVDAQVELGAAFGAREGGGFHGPPG